MSYGDELTRKLLKKQCCACGGIIKDHGKNINLVGLDRLATWTYPSKIHPSMETIITKEKGRAVAVICDICAENKTEIQYAVQLEKNDVVYFPVSTLKKI